MAPTKDSFLDLERQRKKLEENVEKLSKALEYWKQSQEEYESLRKAVQSLPSSASRVELTNTRDQFEGKILDKKELDVIFGPNVAKSAEQVVSLLTNRVDYVSKNVGTLTKQLEDAQNKLAAVTVVTNPDATDEEGLPITEIMEELDDDDNVISYTLRTPGDNRPQILETLRKAGIIDFGPSTNENVLPEISEETQQDESQPPADDQSQSVHQSKQPQDVEPPTVAAQPAEQTDKSPVKEQPKPKPKSKKKSVAFAEDTKPEEEQTQSDTAKRLEEILQKARDQQSIISNPVFPADESPEDAELREDMIRYNKETMEYEMAPIVAELQLEEGSSTDDTGDYSDDDDDDEEDEFGRTKVHVDDDWKRYMLELKEKLSGYEFKKDVAVDDDDDLVEGIGRITIKHEGQDTPNVGSEPVVNSIGEDSAPVKDVKKSVKFAESVDIAEAPAPKQTRPKQTKQSEVDPISDVVMERNGGTPQPRVASSKKTSRFRKARNTEPAIVKAPVALDGTPIAPDRPNINIKPIPSGPEGQTVAKSVLEHEPSSEVKEPDEFDANLLHNQATEEYHKMRNRLVHRNGGFMKEDESPIQPLDEEEGGPKRVSRFKAARLGKP
ncbi:Prefoldin subunit-domain-containing protein [Annulohypoxylon truncatum]|uniref:Prefoldin subunit-domain-containing protein n=1 Tax=Annulohypoxylon truncatum TaxID=327061 RepID=UPI002007AE85|nr:Prefoldin subunit-domain-containing protein [Annulohypoxylon truncatum]KAI1209606.1 Prefoldin subunit-domain-containing protein [Annulohypoxylon truncatum]